MATKTETARIEKVEASSNPHWSRVTVRDQNGQSRVIEVRKGSRFKNRPKPNN